MSLAAEASALHAGGMQSTSFPRGTRWSRSPPAIGLALGAVADLLLADPRRGHPVAGFGRAAAALERRVWRDARPAGAGDAPALTGAGVGLGTALDRLTRRHPAARVLVTAAATWTVLGGTSLG